MARSTFASQNAQNTSVSDHFWKLRCRKSARRCGAKHISKSKCTKHPFSDGPLLEVEMSKKCTPLWREAHFEVKMYKTPLSDHFWKLRCRKSARRCGAKHISKSKCTKHTRGSDHFWRFRCRFASLHYITLHYTHCTALHYTTYTTLQLQLHNYTPLHSTTLNHTTLNHTTLHYITLHYTPLHYITLHYTTFHYTSLHYFTLHYITTTTTNTQLHSTTLNYTTPHYITLHYTTFHYTSLHCTTLHYTTLH